MSNTNHVPSNTERGSMEKGAFASAFKRPAKVSGEGNMRAEPEDGHVHDIVSAFLLGALSLPPASSTGHTP